LAEAAIWFVPLAIAPVADNRSNTDALTPVFGFVPTVIAA
jgi:hypothetical protein